MIKSGKIENILIRFDLYFHPYIQILINPDFALFSQTFSSISSRTFLFLAIYNLPDHFRIRD